ncbi:MAG: C40 family peptidase [Bacteroidia bacterium]|nr:C40 family peptidase [Bacteroidia bacterium]
MYNFGICTLSVIPGRKEASDSSEMTTQILFGETFLINNQDEKWAEICLTADNYSCWVSTKQITPLTKQEFEQINKNSFYLINDTISVIINKTSGHHFPVTAGGNLPDYLENTFKIAHQQYTYEGEVSLKNQLPSRIKIVEKAFEFLNAPYLWGGRTILGIDCSGFTQLVYNLNGIALLRDAYQQAEKGLALSFIDETQEGDLAFFDNEEGKIIHVGIVLKNKQIIHASGKVRVDLLDHFGIFNQELKKYTHRLRLLKNYLSA